MKMLASSPRIARGIVLLSATALILPGIAVAQAPSVPAPVEDRTDNRSPEVIAVPVPLPLPGQLKPAPRRLPPPAAGRSRPTRSPPAPAVRVGAANEAARVQPERAGFVNAIQQYPYTPGALYQIYAAPGQVTDIALQEGEQLVGPGPVASGDTVRWMIGDTVSGTGALARVHILVKPTRADITTNLVINTDRRTYHMELRATPSTYMASVSWTYPQDELIALHRAREAAAESAPVAAGIALNQLNFGYSFSGDRPDWRPVRAFDDGVRVYIEFPESIAQGEMPPLFVIGAGGEAELVNYRVSGRYMIVDRLFAEAELRMGDRRSEKRVRIRAARRRQLA